MTSSANEAVSAEDLRRTLLQQLLAQEGLSTGTTDRIRPSDEASWAPLSFSQQWLWLFDQTFAGNSAYAVPSAQRLTGMLNSDAVAEALSRIVQSHEALRSTFARVGEVPRQEIQPAAPVPVPVHDLSALPADEREQAASARIAQQIGLPFDLSNGPLLRAEIIRMAPDDHVLILTMHHIVGDAQSVDVLMRELIAGYNAIVIGQAPTPTALPVQYRDYARWQRARFTDGGTTADLLRFWRDFLADPPPTLELPAQRPRPALPGFRGGVVRFHIDADLVAKARQAGRTAGATPFMVWLTVFNVLLHRYTGRSDIIVGSPVANRDRDEIAPLIGFFVNTVPIRTRLAPGDSFRSLLATTRRQASQVLAHQEMPFEKIVEELNPTRSMSSAPYFQTVVSYRTAVRRAEVAGLTVRDVPVHNGTSKRDLTVHLVEDGDALSATFEFDLELFDPSTIERMSRHFLRLASALLDAPDAPIAHVPMLTAEESRAQSAFNGPAVTFADADTPMHEVFERQAVQRHDALAVRYGEETLTYAELNQRANELAHHLIELGVRAEVKVGLCIDRSIEMIIGLLGILKAGGAYVPLDPHDSDDRRRRVMAGADATIVLVVNAADGGWAAVDARVVVVDRTGESLAGRPTTNPGRRCAPGNVAYLLYTSGSTGQPKGVVIEHRNLLNYTFAIMRTLGITDPIRYAMVQPLVVDSVVTLIAPALCSGGELHLVDRVVALDAGRLARYCSTHAIDLLKMAPSHVHALQQSAVFADILPRRHLVIGGEASDWAWVCDLQRTAGDCTVYNHYGHTETTVGMMVLPIREHLDADAATAPIGPPIANTTAYVLDDHWQPVPVGVPGELCVGGANVGRGYHRRADLTANAFIPDPFSAVPGARLYRSGDIVRMRIDRTIDFLGRRDDQIKIRGFRVELGEITAAVKRHPHVADSIVLVRADTAGGRRLVAYVAPRDGASIDALRLQEYLATQLPAHMLPETIVALPALPLSRHGKVDRQALPAPTGHTAAASDRPELSELEQVVGAIWARLLHVETIDAEQNFFDVGGHSLLVMRLHQELQAALGREFDLIELFQHTTVRAQADFFAQRDDVPAVDRVRERGGERGRKQSQQMRRRQQLRRPERGPND